MDNAPRDENHVPTALFEIDSAPGTVMPGQINEITGRILVNASGGGGSGLVIGSTTITGGTTTRILFNNAGVVGEYVITGTGSVVMSTSPTLVTPALGTPTSVVLTNATGLPVSTGITGLGTGVATALAVNIGTAGAFVVNGGALGTPSSGTLTNATGLPISSGVSGLGTGVATALGVNTGSAGAFVLFNGALGTPTSGTVTNLTGTASININGTVGATTPTTATFTTATINTSLVPDANDGAVLGAAATAFSDLFLASGAVIGFANGNYTLTHSSGVLTASGLFSATAIDVTSTTVPTNGIYQGGASVLYFSTASTSRLRLSSTELRPEANDGLALGTSAVSFSDLFLAEGGVINWDNGDITLTQTGNELVLAGGNLDIGTNILRIAGNIDIDGTPATDDTFVGPSTDEFQASATIAQWEAVYLNSSSQWALTDADAAATAGTVMVALATEAGTASNALRVVLPGSFVRNDAWTWTVGGPIYLSTTAGALTQTAPSATDDVVRIVGYAMNADVIFWNPSNDFITIV